MTAISGAVNFLLQTFRLRTGWSSRLRAYARWGTGNKEPWRMAISYLYHMYGNDIHMLRLFDTPKFMKEKNDKLEILFKMLSRKINSPLTSSVGRLFDGVASLLDLQHSVNYEGQAAVKLESIADECETGHYPFDINTNAGGRCNVPIIIQWQPVIKRILEDLQHKIAYPIISARFHNSILEMVVQVCTMLRDSKGINDVVLSGGVFQNNFLSEPPYQKLKLQGFTVYSHQKSPLQRWWYIAGTSRYCQ